MFERTGVSVAKVPRVVRCVRAEVGEVHGQRRKTFGDISDEVCGHGWRWRIREGERNREIVHGHGVVRGGVVHIGPAQIEDLSFGDCSGWPECSAQVGDAIGSAVSIERTGAAGIHRRIEIKSTAHRGEACAVETELHHERVVDRAVAAHAPLFAGVVDVERGDGRAGEIDETRLGVALRGGGSERAECAVGIARAAVVVIAAGAGCTTADNDSFCGHSTSACADEPSVRCGCAAGTHAVEILQIGRAGDDDGIRRSDEGECGV